MLKLMPEHYVQSLTSATHPLFVQLGIMDAVIGVLADQGVLVLTNDLDLALILESRKCDCVHYDRILRPLTLDPQ
jgi:hypothetical protein